MSAWATEQIDQISHADELEITSFRVDGTSRRYRTVWIVRVGDDLYVRSARGPQNPWFRGAMHSGHGRIRVDGAEHDVHFTPAPTGITGDVDAAYHVKYDRYGARIVGSVLGPEAASTTLRVTPA